MKYFFLFISLLILTSCSHKSLNSAEQLQKFEESNRGILVYTFSVRKDTMRNGYSHFFMKNITNGKVRAFGLIGNINTREDVIYENEHEKRFLVNMTVDPGDYIFYSYRSFAEKQRGLTFHDLHIPVGTVKEKEITYIGNFYPEEYRIDKIKRKEYRATIFSRNDELSNDSIKILETIPNLGKYPWNKNVIEGLTL